MRSSWSEREIELRKARHAFFITLAFNLLVASSKLICGFISGTLTMVADGFHSLLDVSANIIAILGLGISLKPPDSGHPYGHRKFEALAAIAISFFMFLASFQVLSEALHRFISKETHSPNVSFVNYAIMIVTVAINYFVSAYENRKGRELRNNLLIADSKHTLSDIYASLTVLATLVAIQLNFPILDTVASLIIVGILLKAGFEIILTHMGTLVDAAVLKPDYIEKLVLEVPGVTSCHKIRSRGMNDHIFLDLHVQVPRHLSIEEAHDISFHVENKLKEVVTGVVDVLVHIEDDAPPHH